ncbi:MAG TPA: Rad52/Rad22 family DNA repair protein [Chloroflexota bacterium]
MDAQVPGGDRYPKLAAPFEGTFKDVRGGVELEYITGEQCISRLNEVLGVAGWSFVVREHGVHEEADEVWVLGELTAWFGERAVTRQQFGSQKIKRARSTGVPLDIGFDLKGAATDALKKCAQSLGVGLYLARKEVPSAPESGAEEADERPAGVTRVPLACEECGQPLVETRFKDGTSWTPTQLAAYGQRKHGRVLCMEHYRLANELRRRFARHSQDASA